jgi:hypothetical protein
LQEASIPCNLRSHAPSRASPIGTDGGIDRRNPSTKIKLLTQFSHGDDATFVPDIFHVRK